MRAQLGLLLLSMSMGSLALAETRDNIPRPSAGRWSVDTTGSVRQDTLLEVDRLGLEVNSAGLGQLAVVVVRNTSGRDPRALALDLFNHWGIGRAGRNDGVLLFVAIEDRAAEIILGSGVDGPEDQSRSDQIMSGTVVPAFKRGDKDGAITGGARGLADLLRQSPINAGSASGASSEGQETSATRFPIPHARGVWVADLDNVLSPEQAQLIKDLTWRVEATGHEKLAFVFFDSVLHPASSSEVAAWLDDDWGLNGTAWIIAMARVPAGQMADTTVRWPGAFPEPVGRAYSDFIDFNNEWIGASVGIDVTTDLRPIVERTEKYLNTGTLPFNPARLKSKVSEFFAHLWQVFLTALLGLAGFGAYLVRGWLRRRPRTCDRCGRIRRLLDERWDDAHLTEGQRKEEQLKSVDYDVWWCEPCGDALVLRYKAWFSSFAQCSACQFITAKQTTRTIVAATYDHGGRVEVTQHCTHCGHIHRYERHTPRLTRSSSHSSSFSSSRSSSSFGGGRSSGGGSSGRW